MVIMTVIWVIKSAIKTERLASSGGHIYTANFIKKIFSKWMQTAKEDIPSYREFRGLPQKLFNPLKGRGVNWLHFAIQV